MDARARVLITAAELASLIQARDPVTILDVRWQFDEPDQYAAYLQGHIPGAVYVSLEHELSDHTIVGRGRHPLPAGHGVQAAARRWGIRQDALVVAYDDWNRAASGRAWWVLTAAGLTDVRVLDGGLAAWRSAEGRLDTGPVTPRAGNITVPQRNLYEGSLPTLTAQQCFTGGLTLIDTRAPERFSGDLEPIDPVAGHIPGAKNIPSTAVLASDGTFLDESALRQTWFDHDIEYGGDVGLYCGSGITATVTIAALAAVGCKAPLFPGSWSEWISDPTRPIARSLE